MRKGIVLLLVAMIYGSVAFADVDNNPTDPPCPTITIPQEQFDSLISAAAKVDQTVLISSKSDNDNMFSDYINHVSWVVGLFGVLITIIVGLLGAFVPYMTNKSFRKKMEEKINSITTDMENHEQKIIQSEEIIQEFYDKQKEYDIKMKDSEQFLIRHEDELKKYKQSINEIKAQINSAAKAAKVSEEKASASAMIVQALSDEDIDKRIELYTQYIEKEPNNADNYNKRGIAFRKKENYDQAIKDYDKAIELNPHHAKAYNNRGCAYRRRGDNDQAIKDYNKAIELDPRYAKAYYNRGIAYSNKGDYDQAIKDYDKAIELNPQYAYAYNNRGNAYRKKGDYDQAIRDYDKAIELNPQYARAYNNLGYAYLGKNNFPAALEAVNRAIALAPTSSSYYDSRADVWVAWGKYKKEHPDEYPDIDWKDNIRNALSDVENAFLLNPNERLKKMLEDKCAECKQLLEE